VSKILLPAGFSSPVGRHFPVWRKGAAGIDVALPRAGGERFATEGLAAAVREASRHRDLTINAMACDPLAPTAEQALLDPHGGRADLAARRLRAVDASTFGEDPLRLLRVARLAARLEADVDDALRALCRGLSLDDVPVERIATELLRILTECPRPSIAFAFLAEIDRLDVFPPIAALAGVPQDPRFHPEGDVAIHTAMVVDRAAEIAEGLADEEREVLLLAALCHDLGKPATTTVEEGRVRALGHEARSAACARAWLEGLRLPERSVRAVEALVADHLAPSQLVRQGAGPRAYRRLARRLAAGGVDVRALERLARADHLGRTTPEALAGRFEAGERFLEAAARAGVGEGVGPDVVSAAQLIERGVEPGPELGRLLARCREIQDETGLGDARRIVDRALREARARG
jgi:tRNA nucleotidyltransferase (CCA-adding enzyme)